MPKGREKSGRFRRIKKTTPGGNRVTHYTTKLPRQAKCAKCSAKLSGIPRMKTADARRKTKTKKTNARPFGGYFCSKCSRDAIKKKARGLA